MTSDSREAINFPAFSMTYLQGKMYEARKKSKGGDYGNQYTKMAKDHNDPKPKSTADIIAAETGEAIAFLAVRRGGKRVLRANLLKYPTAQFSLLHNPLWGGPHTLPEEKPRTAQPRASQRNARNAQKAENSCAVPSKKS